MVGNANDLSLEFYRRMSRIREFETRAEALHAKGRIPGSLHTATGQEGEIVGACMALRDDDYMVGNHRSHGHPIAKGARLAPLMAELMARSTGVCRGKGGSMHLSDFSVGSLGETSIVGSGLPTAVGAALASRLRSSDRVTLCFFGDGASNEGTFHESLNLAAIWKLPVVFLCENNGYGISTPISTMIATEHIADRGSAYAIPSVIVDGQDVRAVYDVTAEAVARARRQEGPTLIEAKTYRYADHAVNMGRILFDRGDEVDRWRARDPIALLREELLRTGVAEDVIAAIEAEVVDEVAAAIAFAEESPFPAPEEAFEDVYAEAVAIPPDLILTPAATEARNG